jgi:uncharacterized protein (DUF58 family)
MRPLLPEAPVSIFPLFFTQIFMLLFLFLALLFDVIELTLFSLLILTMSLGSYLWSRISLNNVKCSIELNRLRLFPDEELKIGIRAINSKLLPVRFGIHLYIPRTVSGTDTGHWIAKEIGLLWFQQAVFFSQLHPNKRGVYDLGPPRLRGGDLFGFFFRKKVATEQFEIVVYPRIVSIRPILIPKKEFYGIPGARSPVEDPIYVFGTRDYQPGRPARGIHWKASARHHRLQEKLCEPAEQEKVLILLDVDQFENEPAMEDFERSLEVIASFVLQMDLRGIAIGFVTNAHIHGGRSKIIPISRSPMQLQVILETLARAKTNKKQDPLTGLISKGYNIPWGVSCLYFAYQLSTQTRSAGAFMKHRKIPIRFIVTQRSGAFEMPEDSKEENTCYLNNLLSKEISSR